MSQRTEGRGDAVEATAMAMGYLPTSKIMERHRDRLAMVYVRQSTPQQLVKHQESTRLQYGLKERALGLGWSRDRIEVIDDDQGRSGASAEGRPGFQRLVAEVGLDHVGLILGVEMSRLARSNRDWHQLLEVCAIFGTLICDLDGVYDPANYNDRLLLGLKGTMSEAELHILKQRMYQGRLAKARRGELNLPLPRGYVRRPSGEAILDPDEQVRSVVARVFEQFELRGTIYGVLRDLVDHGVQLPVRSTAMDHKGELEWRRPNRQAIFQMLHDPMFAGAYVYGKRPSHAGRRYTSGRGTGRTTTPFGQWPVLIKDRLPAYITWSQYERNVKQLAKNRAQAEGVPRQGLALLAGLVRCGRCGSRMHVHYKGNYLRYACLNRLNHYGAPPCTRLSGHGLDECVKEWVLRALEPSALEVSLRVAEDLEAERVRAETAWQQKLERSRYEADRVRRQYDAAEPENRLVVRTLERQLEQKLAAVEKLQEDYDRYCAQQPVVLSAEERASIRALAADIPALWAAATTTAADRKTIVRQLVEDVIVNVEGHSERVAVEIRWVGGHRTQTTLIRPVGSLERLTYCDRVLARIKSLRAQGRTAEQIAERLNREGLRPPKRRATFNADQVLQIVSRQGLARVVAKRRLLLNDHEWSGPDLARELSMPVVTLYCWQRRGWVRGRYLDPAHRQLAVWADDAELARLRALRQAPRRGWRKQDSPAIARA